jgi:hypothetical protein
MSGRSGWIFFFAAYTMNMGAKRRQQVTMTRPPEAEGAVGLPDHINGADKGKYAKVVK